MKPVLNKLLNWLPMTAIILVAVGCKDPEFSNLEISMLTNPPTDADISAEGPNSMDVGISVAISVKPISNNSENFTVIDELELVPQNEDILLVSLASMNGVFVLTSKNVGQTCVDVIMNGKNEGCIDIEVNQ